MVTVRVPPYVCVFMYIIVVVTVCARADGWRRSEHSRGQHLPAALLIFSRCLAPTGGGEANICSERFPVALPKVAFPLATSALARWKTTDGAAPLRVGAGRKLPVVFDADHGGSGHHGGSITAARSRRLDHGGSGRVISVGA